LPPVLRQRKARGTLGLGCADHLLSSHLQLHLLNKIRISSPRVSSCQMISA
jgi:hypothetical protein